MSSKDNIRRVLITGIAGSGASYLADYILENHPGVEVHGIGRNADIELCENIKHLAGIISVHKADLMDFGPVWDVVRAVKPDAIFHLAAYARVRESFAEPNKFLSNNILGTTNILEAVRRSGLDPVIQICSTSEVYGQVDPKDVPIKEEAPLRPVSPYAVSKTAQDLLGLSYFLTYRMKIVRTRMFTYINPRRADLFASSFARQIAWIERGMAEELIHGNLDSVRTIIDVRDTASAYWTAAVKCEYGEAYNIGSTEAVTVGDILKRLISMSDKNIKTRTDPSLMRPADVTLQVPCIDKFVNRTGWKSRYSLDESLEFLLSHWRSQSKKTTG